MLYFVAFILFKMLSEDRDFHVKICFVCFTWFAAEEKLLNIYEILWDARRAFNMAVGRYI